MAAGVRDAQFGGKALARHRSRRRSTTPTLSGWAQLISMAAARLPRRSGYSHRPDRADTCCRRLRIWQPQRANGKTGSCSGSSSTASNIPACPRWPSQQRDDEVWAVVAFLKRLPTLGRRKAIVSWPSATCEVTRQSGREIATAEATAEAVGACARCHGADDRRPPSALVPILHGQPAEFLAAALRAYADGKRESGIMQPVAADLTPEAMRRVAEYYCRLASRLSRAKPARDRCRRHRERARAGNAQGLPAAEIPPCLTCHGPDALNIYPRLAGQNAAYMKGQLRLWKGGLTASDRNRRDHGADRAAAQRPADRRGQRRISRVAAPPSDEAQRP